VQTETFVIFLGNKIKFFSALLIFGSRSVVALTIRYGQWCHFSWFAAKPSRIFSLL